MDSGRCFFFRFFLREGEFYFPLLGPKKKTPLGKRDLERGETERLSQVIRRHSFFFFLDNTIAVVSPIMNRIFSHKRHFKNHFDCEAKKATRAVLVPKAETDDDENDHTRNTELYSLLKEKKKKDETLKECAFGTPQKEEEEEE